LNIQKDILKKYGRKITFINPKIKIIGNDFLMDLKKDLKDIKYIISQSDIVISQYSTILLEALILKKPLINFSTGAFRNTSFSKKEIFSSMHHINELFQYGLYKDVNDKTSLYEEINSILNNELSFKNYQKFYNENLKSIKKNNVVTIEQQLTQFINS
jgi:CDP-glycerol glycerophosphotransferase (TagB/SpsB family)